MVMNESFATSRASFGGSAAAAAPQCKSQG